MNTKRKKRKTVTGASTSEDDEEEIAACPASQWSRSWTGCLKLRHCLPCCPTLAAAAYPTETTTVGSPSIPAACVGTPDLTQVHTGEGR